MLERFCEQPSSDELFARVVNACHLELSTLAFLGLTSDPQTAYGVTKTALPNIPPKEVKRISGHIKGYLEDIITRVSGFAQAETDSDRMTGRDIWLFSLTGEGERMQGVAFFLLTQIRNIGEKAGNITHSDIFTKTTTGKPTEGEEILPAQKRSAYHRARIIEILGALPEDETLSFTRISEQDSSLNIKPVSKNIDSLTQDGIVASDSMSGERKGEITYTFVPDTLLPEDIKSRISRKVFKRNPGAVTVISSFIEDKLRQDPTRVLNSVVVADAIYSSYLQNGHTISRNSFEHFASKVLGALRDNGNLISNYTYFDHSHASLTATGREIAVLLSQIRKACEDPQLAERMLAEFRAVGNSYLEEYGPLFIEAQEGNITHQSRELRIREIINLLGENPDGLRREKIDQLIGRDVGELLSHLKTGEIIEQRWEQSRSRPNRNYKRGRASIYSLSEKARQFLVDKPDISYEELKSSLKNQ